MRDDGLDNPLRGLFPEEVATEIGSIHAAQESLYPQERACVQDAVDKRRREFAAGRTCARRAMARLGIDSCPLLVGRNRVPVWPPGIAGSISHCEDYCCVAVARKTQVDGLGLDVERIDRVREDLWQHICTYRELTWVDSLPCGERRSAVALIFSAKEALYKCQYPIFGQWLGFTDLTIHVDPDRHEYDVEPAGPRDWDWLRQIRGTFTIRDNHVFTGTTFAASGKATQP